MTHPPQEQQENENTPDFGTKLESIKHIGDMVDGKMVCREDCPSVTHRNTPDTEWDENTQHAYDSILFNHNPIEADKQFGQMLESVLNNLLTSRDTHWKEMVRKEVAGLQERFGDWDNGDENEPLLLKCEVLGILDNLK